MQTLVIILAAVLIAGLLFLLIRMSHKYDEVDAAHDIEIVAAGWATVGDDGSRRDDTPRARATQLP